LILNLTTVNFVTIDPVRI